MEGKGGREAATEGRVGGGCGGQARAGGLAARAEGNWPRGFYSVMPRHGYMARHRPKVLVLEKKIKQC